MEEDIIDIDGFNQHPICKRMAIFKFCGLRKTSAGPSRKLVQW
jgi:hypothetical protein